MTTKNFKWNGFSFNINYQVGETIANIFPDSPEQYWKILKIGKKFMMIQSCRTNNVKKIMLPKENYFPTYIVVDEEYKKHEAKYFDGFGTENWYYAHGGN